MKGVAAHWFNTLTLILSSTFAINYQPLIYVGYSSDVEFHNDLELSYLMDIVMSFITGYAFY